MPATTTWRKLIETFAANATEVDDLLLIVPKLWRSGPTVLAAFANEVSPRAAHMEFVRKVFDGLPHAADEVSAKLRSTVRIFEVFDGIALDAAKQQAMARTMQNWAKVTFEKFLQVRRAIALAHGEDEAKKFMRWLLTHEFADDVPRLRLDELRKNHPTFRGGAPDAADLRKFEAEVGQLTNWRPADVEIRMPDGSLQKFAQEVDFGRALEARCRSVVKAAGDLKLDLDVVDLTAKSTADKWRFGGAFYDAAQNFPGADFIYRKGLGFGVGQISHGTAGSLKSKFVAFLNLGTSTYNDAHYKMVEHLQYLAQYKVPGLINFPNLASRGTTAALDAGSIEVRKISTLHIPAQEVPGLRAVLASDPNFGQWCQTLGKTADQLLEIVQPILTK